MSMQYVDLSKAKGERLSEIRVRKARERFSLALVQTGEPGRTKQHFKDTCDINKIVARWRKTGVLEHVSTKVASYGAFTQPNDLAEAYDQVNRAEELFHELPSEIRKRFDNDAIALIEFLEDPANVEESQELGLRDTPRKPGNSSVKPDPAPRAQPPERPEAALSSPQPKATQPSDGEKPPTS